MADTTPGTDPLPAKLLEWFRPSEDAPGQAPGFDPGQLGLTPGLLGVPLAEVADQVNAWFADRARELIQAERDKSGVFRPWAWVLVVPVYLLWGRTQLSTLWGPVPINTTRLIPDWTILLIRSPAHWADQMAGEPPILSAQRRAHWNQQVQAARRWVWPAVPEVTQTGDPASVHPIRIQGV